MKKFICLLLGVILCLSLCVLSACGGNNGGNGGGNNSTDAAGTTSSNAGGTTSSDNAGTTSSNAGGTTSSDNAGTTSSNTGSDSSNAGGSTSSDDPSDEKLLEFSGITFNKATFDYDGTEKSIVISGQTPTGTTVDYTSNKATDAGVYNATATLSCQGYKSLTLNATLTINKINITGITFEGATCDYDGKAHSIAINGTVPSGASVKYYLDNKEIANASFTDAGVYAVKAVVSGKNYNALELKATLTINKIVVSGITFEGAVYEYDSLPHSLAVEGNVPNGATVKYYYQDKEIASPTFTNVGVYEIKVVVSGENFNTFKKTATLVIKSTEELLYSVNHNGTIYFQNNLDNNSLYSYAAGKLTKVNRDNAKYLVSDGTNTYYLSTSLFGSYIKQLNASIASPLYNVNGEYLVSDGTYIYFAINNALINREENGIYKYKIEADEDELAVRISTDKAKYLVLVDGYIYYANASDGNKLCKVSTTANNATGTVLWDEKVEYIITDGTNLYFNSTNGLLGGSAIRKYVISSNTCIKLTTDAGKYLAKVDSYIYYINNDLLTSTIFGDGLYRVSVAADKDNNLPGSKVISAVENDGFSSLTTDGTYLYYYKLSDKHFYRYTIANGAETDLLDGFVVKETELFVGGAYIAEYEGEIYYANIRDMGYLYKYNPKTKLNVKVLDEQVDGIYFYNDYMYYSTYVLTNYAFWRMDLKTFTPVKLSSDRLDKVIFDGGKMYFLKVGSAYNNYIYSVELSALETLASHKDFMNIATKLYDVTMWVNDFYKVGDYLYCAANAGLLGKDDYLHTYCISTKTATKSEFETTAFTVTENGTVYYYDSNNNTLSSYDGTTSNVLVNNVEITDLIFNEGKIYYSSSSTQNQGLFVYDVNTKANTKISSQNAHALTVVNGNVYFMQTEVTYTSDYPTSSKENGNSAKLCRYNGKTVEVLAG